MLQTNLRTSGGSGFGLTGIACIAIDIVLLVFFVGSGMNANLHYLKLGAMLIFIPGPLAVLLGIAGLIWDAKKTPAVVALGLGFVGTLLIFSIGG